MPIIPLYLLKNYLKVLFLSVFSFIAILLASQLEEIAQFAAMGAKLSYILLFTFYQIPYILPIAIPISCLIAALILFQRMSQSHELTALRSCGIALKRILIPILAAGALLSLLTFYIASELATASHLATRKMVHDLSSVNPILLLQSAKAMGTRDVFVQMDPLRNGKSSQNLLIALHNPSQDRLTLCMAKQIDMEEENLAAKQVSVLMSAPKGNSFDHLIIENSKMISTSASELASLFNKSGWRMANDHLKLRLLLIRLKMLRTEESALRQINKCYCEIIRRFSLGLSAFTFSLMGSAFGLKVGRSRSRWGIATLLALSAAALISFCMGKANSHIIWLSSLYFLLPHVFIIWLSVVTVKRVNRGCE